MARNIEALKDGKEAGNTINMMFALKKSGNKTQRKSTYLNLKSHSDITLIRSSHF